MTIYQAMYNPMNEESCAMVLSLHITEAGAQVVIDLHREKVEKEWNELYKNIAPPVGMTFETFKDWFIKPVDLLD